MQSLTNKRILLGITGGIAAYKSAELCRLLVKAGAEVRVVMTGAAREFITPLTLQALSGNRVHTDLLDEEAEAAMGHIELARWADLLLVAPASADFIARLAAGEAGDLLAAICLASQSPIALAPAMNQAMWSNERSQFNLNELKNRGITVFNPGSGDQACGETGPGRMREPEEIAALAADMFSPGFLAGLSVTLTAGPTREAIDPVRFISNHSSGKMGYALAQAAMEAGARVTLVSGPVALPAPQRVNLVQVESAREMLDACLAHVPDIFIGVAAVADYRPRATARQKIKKKQDTMEILLERNPDILASMAALPERPFCVGFAAETENLEANAREKLRAKKLDLIFANDAAQTFNQDEATVFACWEGGSRWLDPASKPRLARAMVHLISERRKP